MYLYLYFHFGSATVGDCDSPYFLETSEAIQEAVEEVDCNNRDEAVVGEGTSQEGKEIAHEHHRRNGRVWSDIILRGDVQQTARARISSEWWRVSLLKPPQQRKRARTRQIAVVDLGLH